MQAQDIRIHRLPIEGTGSARPSTLKTFRTTVIVALCMAAGLPAVCLAQPEGTEGPSFSCSAASTDIEKMICQHPELAARDKTMATLFKAARVDALNQGSSQQQAQQQQWLKQRNKQCAQGDMGKCLTQVYDERVSQLAVATLFNAPQAAMAAINLVDPKAAPLYEAIYRYVTTADDAQRAAAVAPLISPSVKQLEGDNYSASMLDHASAHDIAASDATFSMFLDVASAKDDLIQLKAPLTLSCAAAIRRPGLMTALGSVYGSTMDIHLIRTDCDVMMPALPALDSLTEAAEQAQPQDPDSGTIRFAVYRDYYQLLQAIRLHHVQLWNKGVFASDNSPPGKAESRFIEAQQPLIQQATAQLSAYYTNQFAVPDNLATEQAQQAVNKIVSGAFSFNRILVGP